MSCQSYEIALPLAVAASRDLDVRTGWHLSLVDIKGRAAFGDIAIWPGFGACEPEVLADLERLSHTVQSIPEDLCTLDSWLSGLKLCSPVRHGLEGASLDLLGQWNNQSVTVLLGGPKRGFVSCHELVYSVSDLGPLKSSAIKVKVGGQVEDDLERVRDLHACLVRRCGREDIQIRVDGNGKWTREQAAAFISALAPHHAFLFEQLTAPTDLPAFEWLKQRTGARLSADESVVHDLEAVLSDQAIEDIVIKPMFVGGAIAALKIAKRALANTRTICVTHSLESKIGRALAVAVAASSNSLRPHGIGDGQRRQSIYEAEGLGVKP